MAYMRDPRMLTAPAPNSKAGRGSHIPLRTKPPTVVRYESGFATVGPAGSGLAPSTPRQYGRSALIFVAPSSNENWNPAYPSVSAGVIRRGAIATPSSDIWLRKSDCASASMVTGPVMSPVPLRWTHEHSLAPVGWP